MSIEKYKNLDGNSGVKEFQVGDDFIIVTFKTGSKYLYTYKTPGKSKVDRMIALARTGKGLNSYICSSVDDQFEKRLK